MENENTPQQDALNEAIESQGGITAFAKALGLSGHGVVHQWRINRVPADYCPTIEQITGVRCERIRPDVNWSVLRGKRKASAQQ